MKTPLLLSDLDATDFFYCFILLARNFGMCWIGMVKAFSLLLSITLTIDFSYLPFIKLRKFPLILWVFIMIGRRICQWPFLHLVIIINHVGKLVLHVLIWWKRKLLSHVQLFVTPMDYTTHGILQARILEWIAFPFSRGIFPIQGSNPGLPHCRWILYQLRYEGSH